MDVYLCASQQNGGSQDGTCEDQRGTCHSVSGVRGGGA